MKYTKYLFVLSITVGLMTATTYASATSSTEANVQSIYSNGYYALHSNNNYLLLADKHLLDSTKQSKKGIDLNKLFPRSK